MSTTSTVVPGGMVVELNAPLMPGPGVAVVVGGGPLELLQAKVMDHLGWRFLVVEPQPRRRDVGSVLGLDMYAPADPALDEHRVPR